MHCPQCGQQIISDDMRFCKHCGFALDGVRDLFAPKISVKDTLPGLLSIRVGADPGSLKGLNQAAFLLLLSFLPIVLAIAQGVFSFNVLPPLLLIRVFFALLTLPLLRFGYAIYEARQAGQSSKKTQIGTSTHELELPEMDSASVTASLSAPPVKTRETIQPPSITEHTTKLLTGSETDQ